MGARDSAGVILDPNNYEGGINHIEIPHERTWQRKGALKEVEKSNLAIGIGKIDVDCANWETGRDLRCFGRRANLFGWKMVDMLGEKEDFS